MSTDESQSNTLADISTVSTDSWHATVRLSGELDVAAADPLRAAITEHLDAGRRVIHVDTADVTFMDSTAIGAIVALHSRCKDEGGSLILTNVQGPVERLIRITGLDQVLLIDTSGE